MGYQIDMAFLSSDGGRSEWQQETQTKEKVDWTHFLAPEATGFLRKVLEAAYKHRQAYFKADDIKNAQLWSAMLEMQREVDELKARLEKMTPREQSTFRLGLGGDNTVLNRIKAAAKPAVEDTREATNALIESLMRF